MGFPISTSWQALFGQTANPRPTKSCSVDDIVKTLIGKHIVTCCNDELNKDYLPASSEPND